MTHMRKIGAFAAKTNLSQLLEQTTHGKSFAITKHGRVVAFLIPAESKSQLPIAEVIAGIIHLRNKIAKHAVKMTSQDIDAFKKQGRR